MQRRQIMVFSRSTRTKIKALGESIEDFTERLKTLDQFILIFSRLGGCCGGYTPWYHKYVDGGTHPGLPKYSVVI
jgi:hypothetical protein